jgi:hypothetical protein
MAGRKYVNPMFVDSFRHSDLLDSYEKFHLDKQLANA